MTGFPGLNLFDTELSGTDVGGAARGGQPGHGPAFLAGGLDGACAAAATRLGVDGLGINLTRAGGLRTVLGGTGRARRLELAELTTGEGPAPRPPAPGAS